MTTDRFKRFLSLIGVIAVFLSMPAISYAENNAEAEDVTNGCTFAAPVEGRALRRMRDQNVETYTTLGTDEALFCAWTDETAVSGLYLEWHTLPDSATLVQRDASGAELASEELADSLYNAYYALLPQTRSVSVASEQASLAISEIALYSAGTLPDGVHAWQPPFVKADLLVISAHADDELLYFGGTIPTYAGERGYSVQVAYMACGDRLRIQEALEGLWLLGVRNAPVFLGFQDVYTESLRDAERRWGHEATVAKLVETIRRFEPEVVVTHDLNGEYGHGAHMATAACTLEAVSLAADSAYAPASAQEYGAWQTQKLYLHLYPENTVTMDWRTPLSAFGGKTALEMANEAYALHVSQQAYHQTVYDTGDYSSAEFGLAYTVVGADETGGDFLENVDPARLSDFVAASPTPTAAPTQMPEPTAVPTVAPAATQKKDSEVGLQNGRAGLIAGGCALLLIAGIYLFVRLRKVRGRSEMDVRRSEGARPAASRKQQKKTKKTTGR